LEAIWSHFRRKESEFVRTPKYGVTGRHGKDAFRPDNVFSFKRLTIPIIEIAFGIYMCCFIFISVYYRYAIIGLPFLLIFAGGYLYVGFSSLGVLWRMHQQHHPPRAELALVGDELVPVSVGDPE
ncbi:MAG: hypothetical protein RMJ35_09015, partial [Phycisphaerales bacterium]|nr:hypothetical protein [Phycisphaerales bacterium]